MLLQFERDPTFRNDDHYDLTKEQQRERVMTRVSRPDTLSISSLADEHDPVCEQ